MSYSKPIIVVGLLGCFLFSCEKDKPVKEKEIPIVETEDSIIFEDYFSFSSEQWEMKGNWSLTNDVGGGSYRLNLRKVGDTTLKFFGSEEVFKVIDSELETYLGDDAYTSRSYLAIIDDVFWQWDKKKGFVQLKSLDDFRNQDSTFSTVIINDKYFLKNSNGFIWGVSLDPNLFQPRHWISFGYPSVLEYTADGKLNQLK